MREQWDREDAEARRADEVAPKLIAALNRHDIVRADKLVKAGRHGITVPAEIADRIADLLFEWADLVGES
jgi:formiminotetrahydrofolate cyclodeaminase